MTPDNYSAYQAHEAEQERQLARLPVCDNCGDPIQGDCYYLIDDNIYCPECLDKLFRKWVDDYDD